MGKILLIFLISFMMLLCGASSDKPSTNEAPEMEEQELSLKKDREYLDKIRKDAVSYTHLTLPTTPYV